MMVRKFVFHVVSFIATAANAHSLPPCHQDLSGEYPIGYECQGNSGKIFSFGGDRWDTSAGEAWVIPEQRADFDNAKTVCREFDALVPSPREFAALTAEFKNPNTGALPLIFPSKLPKRTSDSYWTAVPFSSLLGYIWDPRTGNTNARYYTDYDFLVVCKK